MRNEKEKYKFIGAKIREARNKKGLSQKDLAEAVGFDSGTSISLIESGERKMSIVDLEKMAEILNEELKYFLSIEPDVRVSFRADGLDKKDAEAIQHIIEMAKKRAYER
ncbi:MAG: helix-turn-helix transcriptional regulator [Candidatus Paceibacterota bacterium]